MNLTLLSNTHLQAAQISEQPKLANKYADPIALTDRKALGIATPKNGGGRSANINSYTFNKHCAGKQFYAPKSPLLAAANPSLQA